MADDRICPCEEPPGELGIWNPPGRPFIAYRVGDFVSFRRSLLTGSDVEVQLKAWRPGAAGDLALQMIEWWAYVGDVLTFYNERIANESYLRTADLAEGVRRLVRLLGYRPRPGIAATGTLAALVTGHAPVTLPVGFPVDSKPGPGQEPQTFELDEEVTALPEGRVPARPPEYLLSPTPHEFLVRGATTQVSSGSLLVLSTRNSLSPPFAPALLRVTSVTLETTEQKTKQTRVAFTTSDPLPPALAAAALAVRVPTQASPVWTVTTGGISGNVVHLAGMQRPIAAGDRVIVTAPGLAPVLATVSSAQEVVWYANPAAPSTPWAPPAAPAIPIPLPHTQLTLSVSLGAAWAAAAATVSVRFALQEVGPLSDQPAGSFDGTPGILLGVAPARFRSGAGLPILIEDSKGAGMKGFGAASNQERTLTASGLTDPPLSLESPLAVLYNLLPVSRGKTVAQEVLGSGDATVAGQEFVLKKSPVTYLAQGAGFVSTVQLRVDGVLWEEVESFYGQPADAAVFVTAEDDEQKTHVKIGDGINGARLPTGRDNVVATYRYGSGATAPSSGQLTVMARPVPNVTGIRNPVAVGGGSDPEPRDQLRRYAPRSVLAFNRAVSADDYEVIAALAPGVVRARSYWAWNAPQQRGLVTVYVGDTPAAVDSAREALAATSDPNRQVSVLPAQPVPTLLLLLVLVDARYEPSDVAGRVRAAFLDADHGLFGTGRLRIGEPVFDSQIAQASLSVPGAQALRASLLVTWRPSGLRLELEPRHSPGQDGFFQTQPSWIWVFTELATHGG
jgi:hypothetical protein